MASPESQSSRSSREEPASRGGLDDELPDTALFWRWVGRSTRPVVGWVLAGLGVIGIVVGYFGVSRESLVAKQIPYLVSGGILGLALVGLGAAFLATDDIRRDARRLDRLEAMVTELYEALLERPDAPPLTRSAAAVTATSANGHGAPGLVALPAGHTFHRADCTMVAGKAGVTAVSDDAIRRRRLEPCRLCEPAAVNA